MKRFFSYFLSLTLVVSAFQVFGQAGNYESNTVYIKFKPFTNYQSALKPDYQNYVSPLSSVMKRYGSVRLEPALPGIDGLQHFYELEFAAGDKIDFLIEELTNIEEIAYAEKIPLASFNKTAAVPIEMDSDLMWYIDQIKMTGGVWDLLTTNKIRIAIVDNAVRLSHEDIRDNIWVNLDEIPGNGIDDDNNGYIDDHRGYDVADRDGNANPPAQYVSNDYFTHGTHVAGIASASSKNSKGTVSIGINAEIIPVKIVADEANDDLIIHNGNGYKGILYAAIAGADIINVSWHSSEMTDTWQAWLDFAQSRGCIIVAAAGNGGGNSVVYPAASPGVIAVGATDNKDFITDFSNYGSYIDVMAPGEGIYSCLAGSDQAYGVMSGTSMSAPIVSALVSLMLSQYPDRRADMESILKAGCDDISVNNWKVRDQIGAGRINVARTLGILDGTIKVGIENPTAMSFNLYPNPATSYFNLPSQIQASSVHLYDMSGRQVAILPVQNGRVNIRDRGLKGLYQVRVESASGLATARIQLY